MTKEKNLTRRLADYLDANGWEGGKVKGKQAGPRRRWIDDDHYVTVRLNNRYLTPSVAFRPNSHQLGVGLTHVGIMNVFDQLFGDQGPYAPFVVASLDQFGAPKWINDATFSSKYGEYVPFEDVVAFIDKAHEQLVNDHLGPAGIRAGVEKFNPSGIGEFYALAIDACEGWNAEAARRLSEITDDLNYPRFLENLTAYLGYDPLNPPES